MLITADSVYHRRNSFNSSRHYGWNHIALQNELNRVEDLLAASRAERDEIGIKYNALSERVSIFCKLLNARSCAFILKKDVPYKNTDQFTSNTNNDLFWPHCVWHDARVFGVVMWKTIQTVYNYVWVQGLCFQAYETFWNRFRILLLNLNLNCVI